MEKLMIDPIQPIEVDLIKLTETATLPTRGSDYAAGWDLYADLADIGLEQVTIAPGQVVKISTGVAVALPAYCFGGLYARSGLASKKGLRPANCVGVIDEDYRGCILVAIRNDSNEVQVIQHGERIAQLVVQPYIPIVFNEVNELPETIRGAGGFGSTGAM